MRYRMMATYRGVPYEAGVGPYGSDVVLFAACPPPEELGFEPATGHWRKRVIRAEVDALWESRPVGTFRDEPCIVLDDLGDRLHIAYLGASPERAAALGYWQVDRGVFELLTPREEVSGLTEERVDKPLLATMPSPASLDNSYPYQPAPMPLPQAAPLMPSLAPPLPPSMQQGSSIPLPPPLPSVVPPPSLAPPLPPSVRLPAGPPPGHPLDGPSPLNPPLSPVSPSDLPQFPPASRPAPPPPAPSMRPPAGHPLDGPRATRVAARPAGSG